MHNLRDKVVLITGAAGGIGSAVCSEVLKEGAQHVRILDIDEKAGHELENNLNDTYGTNKAKFVKCDISNDDQLFGAFEDTKREHGYLDVVINNAAIVKESNYMEIRKQIEVNLIALMNGTLKSVEMMDRNKGGRGGTVINIASVAGLSPMSSPIFTYSTSKCAILQFTGCVGTEEHYRETGVRVLALCYGVTDTPIFDKMTCFGSRRDKQCAAIFAEYPRMKVECAATGTIEAYRKGKTASVWLIHQNKPALDITEKIEKCHKELEKLIEP